MHQHHPNVLVINTKTIPVMKIATVFVTNAQETSGWLPLPGSNVEDKIQLANNDSSNSSDEKEGSNGHEQLVHHEVEAGVQRGHGGGVGAGGGDRGGELQPENPSLGQRCSFG